MIRIALFASGNGSNAENIIRYFKDKSNYQVVALFSNNPKAYALERANNHAIPTYLFNKESFYSSNGVLNNLLDLKVDYIILAGFLWMIPESITKVYSNCIINIHPALLPKYGGKGMYGANVHKAVVEHKEKESGITIHLVNERYDEGEILFQDKCIVEETDTPETVAEKVHFLEYKWFPQVIQQYIEKHSVL